MPPLLVRPMNLPPRRPRPMPPSGRCLLLAILLGCRSTRDQVIRMDVRVLVVWRQGLPAMALVRKLPNYAEMARESNRKRCCLHRKSGTCQPTLMALPREAMDWRPIDKSLLAIPELKRLRDKDHLRYVATHPCLVCGRQPAEAHHLKFSQPSALGRKVSDAFTVPLCALHHRDLHTTGNELAWWEGKRLIRYQ